MSNLLRNPIARAKSGKNMSTPINEISYEISEQDLVGQSGAGIITAIRLTHQGRCGRYFTLSYECSSNHVPCA